MNSPSRSGILLVGHGTRDANGTREFFELAKALSKAASPIPVEGCLLEFQHPTIEEAWQTLTQAGVQHVHVAPLLLFAAGHARKDIPDEVTKSALKTPSVTHEQAGPLSRAPEIIELLSRRVQESIDRLSLSPGERPGESERRFAENSTDATEQRQDTGPTRLSLVMVGRGSHDPCAKADMRILGEIVSRRCGIQHHETAFYAMAEPKLPEVLDLVAMNHPTDCIVIQPHLLFQGRLYDAIARQVDEARQRHPNKQFVVGDYLGPTPEVAQAITRRIG